MIREPQKKVTDDYRTAWDKIFGPKPCDQKEQTPVDHKSK
jgi:hypothetical protein